MEPVYRLVSMAFTPHRLLAVTDLNGLNILLLTKRSWIFLPMNNDSYEADILGPNITGMRVISEVCNRDIRISGNKIRDFEQ